LWDQDDPPTARSLMTIPLIQGNPSYRREWRGICVVTSDGATINTNKRVLGSKNGIAISGQIDPRNGLPQQQCHCRAGTTLPARHKTYLSAEGFEGLTTASNTLKQEGERPPREFFCQSDLNRMERQRERANEISSYGSCLTLIPPRENPMSPVIDFGLTVVVKEK